LDLFKLLSNMAILGIYVKCWADKYMGYSHKIAIPKVSAFPASKLALPKRKLNGSFTAPDLTSGKLLKYQIMR